MNYAFYFVTGDYGQTDEAFLNTVSQACHNGVTLLQLREKHLTTRAYYQRAVAVKKITDAQGLPLIIDDRLDVCLAVNAAGLHIGDDEMPVAVVRRLLGPDKILGVSVKTVAAALAAQKDGANYLGVGAIYATQTKNHAERTSLETLRAITAAVSIPVVAIGGIKQHNIATLAHTGIAGISLVSDIMQSKTPGAKALEIAQTIRQTEF